MGWCLGIGRIGGIVGPLFAGQLIKRNLPQSQLFLAAASLALLEMVIIFALRFMLKPTKDKLDYILEHPSSDSLDAEKKGKADRYWWCDGFIPKQYLVDDPIPRITGTTWICNGGNQEEWDVRHPGNRPSSSRGS